MGRRRLTARRAQTGWFDGGQAAEAPPSRRPAESYQNAMRKVIEP